MLNSLIENVRHLTLQIVCAPLSRTHGGFVSIFFSISFDILLFFSQYHYEIDKFFFFRKKNFHCSPSCEREKAIYIKSIFF